MKKLLKPNKEHDISGVEYKHFAVLRLVNVIFTSIFILVILGTAFFVHQHIYTIIGQMQTILILKSTAGSEAIDFNLMERVNKNWQEKKEGDIILPERNPFVFLIQTDQITDTDTNQPEI